MSGGGLQCAYGAGVLVALAEHYRFTTPDILIAASGSAGTAAYYLSGQKNKIPMAWISLATDKKLVSLFRKRAFDIDYLVDEVYKRVHPLNLKNIAKSKTRFLLPVLRVRDGALQYLRVRDNAKAFQIIKASMAAPFISGRKVKVNHSYYIDGGFGPTIHDFTMIL